MKNKKRQITLTRRDLRTPEMNSPMLNPGGEPIKTKVKSELFLQMWINPSNRRKFMLDGQLKDQDLTSDEINWINTQMEAVELANMSATQRQMAMLKKEMKEELRREMEAEKKARKPRTTKSNN